VTDNKPGPDKPADQNPQNGRDNLGRNRIRSSLRLDGNGRTGLPVIPVDQRFPVFTRESTAARGAPADSQTPNVTAVLRDLLGWRPVPGDSKAFSAALAASFRIRHVEGHVETDYVPRGFAMQADLGSVTGGQASLYARARSSLTHILQLLAGLTPLNPDYDQQKNDAVRALVRNEITRIVEEIGAPGGPRQSLVDSSFTILLGRTTFDDPVLPDDVDGQLGDLRIVFGLTEENVNTVEEERVRTSFWTLADEIQDLGRAWANWKLNFDNADAQGFLGTELVLISRLMEAASEQVDEFEDVLDSVLLGAAERQTVDLDGDGLTLDGLLSWTRRFLREDGRTYLTEGGRIGLENAFEPTVARLALAYRELLLVPLGLEDEVPDDDGGLELTGDRTDDVAVFPSGAPVPEGLVAARVAVALLSLDQLLGQIQDLAEGASDTGLQVELTRTGVDAKGLARLTVRVRAADLPPGEGLALMLHSASRPGALARPNGGTTDRDGDRLTATFTFDANRTPRLRDVPENGRLVVPANRIPLLIVDRDTRRRLFESRTTRWDTVNLRSRRSADSSPEWSKWSDAEEKL